MPHQIAKTALILALGAPAQVFAAASCGGDSAGRKIIVSPSGGNFSTIQEALNSAAPGETVQVQPGTYKGEISFPRSGSSGACISLVGERGAIIDGGNVGISIKDQHYVAVIGMEVRNQKGGDTPSGINVEGSASHIDILNNHIHHVENTSNAHGISFYGNASTPMSDLFVDGNEINDCKLGKSESMVFNGNVTRFTVSRNKIHDNDNIGIDVAGHYGVGPKGQDQARDGTITGNAVYNISSKGNPAYGGSGADGIYVDGGTRVLIEQNKVNHSDIGIEAASENGGQATSEVTIRGNTVCNSHLGNVMMGGASPSNGKANLILVSGNTLAAGRDGQIILQNNTNGITIENNTFVDSSEGQSIVTQGGNNFNLLVGNNQYSGGRAPASQNSSGQTQKGFYQAPSGSASAQPASANTSGSTSSACENMEVPPPVEQAAQQPQPPSYITSENSQPSPQPEQASQIPANSDYPQQQAQYPQASRLGNQAQYSAPSGSGLRESRSRTISRPSFPKLPEKEKFGDPKAEDPSTITKSAQNQISAGPQKTDSPSDPALIIASGKRRFASHFLAGRKNTALPGPDGKYASAFTGIGAGPSGGNAPGAVSATSTPGTAQSDSNFSSAGGSAAREIVDSYEGKSLSNPKVSLAGSEIETEAKTLLNELTEDNSRAPASLWGNEGREAESSDLFTRVHLAYNRSFAGGNLQAPYH